MWTKKKVDFEIWRQAVIIWNEYGGNDPRLPVLRFRLMAGRKYKADIDAVKEISPMPGAGYQLPLFEAPHAT